MVGYGRSQLIYGGDTLPTFITGNPVVNGAITVSSLASPSRMVYDRAGNLWVVSQTNATVMKFTPSQLGQTGSPTPSVVIGFSASLTALAPNTAPHAPTGLAFDGAGNLWIGGASTLLEFTPSQLAVSGNPAPTITLMQNNVFGSNSLDLAFDANGNLWVANGAAGIAEYTSAQLAQGGNQTAAVVLQLPPVATGGGNLTTQTGRSLAFDNGGNLWVGTNAGVVIQVPNSQLAVSGTVVPGMVLGAPTGTNIVQGIAFNPAPVNLPLHLPGN